MRTKGKSLILLAILSVLLAGFWALGAVAKNDDTKKETDKKIAADELPQAVKAAADKDLDGKKIIEVEEETKDGVVSYEIKVKDGEETKEYCYSADGKQLKNKDDDDDDDEGDDDEKDDDDENAANDNGGEIDIAKLPDAVKKTAEKYLGNLKDAEAEIETIDGKKLYEVVSEKNDKETSVFITETGDAVKISKEISVSSVPKKILQEIKDKYPKAKIKEAEEFHAIVDGKEKPEAGYEIEAFIKKDLIVSPDGKITEE